MNCWVGMLLLAAMLPVAACDSLPFGVNKARGCMAPANRGWAHLGLEDHVVMSVAESPWGILAGTLRGGVMWCDPGTGTWIELGLAEWVPVTMLWAPGPTPRLLVGVRHQPGQPVGSQRTPAAVFAREDLEGPWFPWDGGLAEEHDGNVWAFSLAMDPGNPLRLFMGLSAGILRSTDGGLTWEVVQGGPQWTGQGTNAIVVSPERNGRVWAGGGGALFNSLLFRSDDWGETWDVFFPIELPHQDVVLALAVDEADPDLLWAGTSRGVLRSEDGGATWHLSLTLGPPGGAIYALVERGGSLFAFGARLLPAPQPDADLLVYRTDDGGETWTELDSPPGAKMAGAAVLASDGGILLGTGIQEHPGGIWRFLP